MHGLMNRAIQCFVQDTYGSDAWAEIAARADLDFTEFEAMLRYDDEVTDRVIVEASAVLGQTSELLAEDLGTYLVSHPHNESLRRLLRFGGSTYLEFLHSLDDLPDRARLAVSDLILPPLELRERGGGLFTVVIRGGPPTMTHVLLGTLRALADDYGVLVFVEHQGRHLFGDVLSVTVHDADFATGRGFDLVEAERCL